MVLSLELVFRYILSLSIYCFFSQNNNLLIVLLRFECAVLSLALIIGVSFRHSLDMYTRLVVLTFGACEAAVGLALLVLISRRVGRDILNQLRLNKC